MSQYAHLRVPLQVGISAAHGTESEHKAAKASDKAEEAAKFECEKVKLNKKASTIYGEGQMHETKEVTELVCTSAKDGEKEPVPAKFENADEKESKKATTLDGDSFPCRANKVFGGFK